MMDNLVWITLIIVIGIVVIVALRLDRKLRLRRDPDGGLSLETGEKEATISDKSNITVAENMDIKNSTVGDIAGYKVSAGAESAIRSNSIEVAKEAKISDGAQTGDIVGIKVGNDKNES